MDIIKELGQVGCLQGFTSMQGKSELRGVEEEGSFALFSRLGFQGWDWGWTPFPTQLSSTKGAMQKCLLVLRRPYDQWGQCERASPLCTGWRCRQGACLQPVTPAPAHHLLLRNCHQTRERGIAWLILHQNCFLVDRKGRRHTWRNRREAQSHLILIFKENACLICTLPIGSEAEFIIHRFINRLMRSNLKGKKWD